MSKKIEYTFQLFAGKGINYDNNPCFYKLIHKNCDVYYSHCPDAMAYLILRLLNFDKVDKNDSLVDDTIVYQAPLKWNFYQELYNLSLKKRKNAVIGYFIYHEMSEWYLSYENLKPNQTFYMLKSLISRTSPKYRELAWAGITKRIKSLCDKNAEENNFLYTVQWEFPKDYKAWFKMYGIELPPDVI